MDREVSRRKPPNNLTAYDLYLLALDAQGRATQAGIEEAIGLFRQSIAVDPTFSRAWTNLSWAYLQLRDWIGTTRDLEQNEKEAALRAVELDPFDGNAHAALAEAYASVGETSQTEAEYKRALELIPTPQTYSPHTQPGQAASGRRNEALKLHSVLCVSIQALRRGLISPIDGPS